MFDITLTNKAANEMKINKDYKSCCLQNGYLRFIVFAKMLRIHGHLIGFNNNFTIYDQSDSTKISS